jgi:hypothetical protein
MNVVSELSVGVTPVSGNIHKGFGLGKALSPTADPISVEHLLPPFLSGGFEKIQPQRAQRGIAATKENTDYIPPTPSLPEGVKNSHKSPPPSPSPIKGEGNSF